VPAYNQKVNGLVRALLARVSIVHLKLWVNVKAIRARQDARRISELVRMVILKVICQALL
jgi:hypothetical protein